MTGVRARLLYDVPALSDDPSFLTLRVAGLPLLRRHLLAFRQAGIHHVTIDAPSPIVSAVRAIADAQAPQGMTVHVAARGQTGHRGQREGAGARTLEQSVATLVDPRLIDQLVRLTIERPRTFECRDVARDPDDVRAKSPFVVGVPERDEAAPITDAIAASRLMPIGVRVVATEKAHKSKHAGATAGALQDQDSEGEGRVVLDVRRFYWHRVTDAHDAQVATRKVLLATMKATDGIYARTNRRVSLRISRALLNTPVTANMVTAATFVCGLFAAWFVARGHYPAVVAGSVMAWFASMLDGVDGELARAKFQASAFGHWLEMVCDYSFYITLALGLGVGFERATGHRLWLVLGVTAAAGMVFTFAAVSHLKRTYARRATVNNFYLAYQRSVAAPSAGWFMRVTPHLTALVTRAAFPYFFVVFALLGLAKIVLIIFAISTQAFWMVALYASRLDYAAGEGS